MVDNMRIWTEVDTTDPEFTKQIEGKDYKGTSPNPIYLAMKATKIFGPIGLGWGHTELCHEVIEGAAIEGTREKLWCCHVELWYKDPETGERGVVSQWGQSKLLYYTKQKYWKTDEEAPKKSRTGAVTKCLSLLGFSADIWLGYYDREGYRAKAAGKVAAAAEASTQEKMQKRLMDLLRINIGCNGDHDEMCVLRYALPELSKDISFPSQFYGEGGTAISLAGKAYSSIIELRRKSNVPFPKLLEIAKGDF